MLWTMPTFDQQYQKAIELWRGKRPTANVAPGSDVDLLATTVVNSELRNNRYLRLVVGWLFPWTSSGWSLGQWLWLFGLSDGSGGRGRILARGSSGTDALAVTATNGPATVTTGDLLTDTGGRTYQVTETYVFPAPSESVIYPRTVNLSVASVDTGLATNLEAGEVLTFASPPANVTSDATLVLDLDGGCDRETDPEGRIRLLAWLRDPPLSGNGAAIRQVIDETFTGSLRGYSYPKRQNGPNGAGTVDVTALQTGESGAARLPTAAQRTAMAAAITASLPVDTWRNHRVLEVIEHTSGGVDAIVGYTLAPGADASSAGDFAAGALGALVDSYDEGTLELTADKDVSAVILSGHRVVIVAAGVEYEAVVDSVSTTSIILETWPWPAGTGPAANAFIQSGGGVTSLIRAAIVALIDTLGPAKGTYYDTRDADWDDTLRVLWIQREALNAHSDLLDIEVVSIGGLGAADLTPADDADTQVKLITAGEIIVVEA